MNEIIKPSRRGFITGLTSLIVAPAIVRVENLMPVKSVSVISKNIIIDHHIYSFQLSDVVKIIHPNGLIEKLKITHSVNSNDK